MGVSHLNEKGDVQMVDTSHKKETHRIAIAESMVSFPEEVYAQLAQDNFLTKKGGIFHTASIAGIMAVKKTAELIPLCHNIPISGCDIDIQPFDTSLRIHCEVKTNANTGVEMEALTGASMAALCIYDMTKALSHDIIIRETKLLKKEGGKSTFNRSDK